MLTMPSTTGNAVTPAPSPSSVPRRGLARGWQALLDLVFPPRCVACRRQAVAGGRFCFDCRDQVTICRPPWCPHCGRPGSAQLCRGCSGRSSSLDGIRSAALFSGPLRAAIHAFKYQNSRDLSEPLADMPNTALAGTSAYPLTLVPVPLYPARERARGYNQAQLLATALAARVGLPVRGDLLLRTRPTAPQVSLPAAERRSNVTGAFALNPAAAARSLHGQNYLLLDDVFTTGATLEACARVLRLASAASVWALTLARAA